MICSSFGDPCTSCLSTGCPERYCDCKDIPDCFGLFQCVGDCNGDQTCVNDCYVTHAEGFSAASLLTDCAATTCPDACPGNQGNELTPCNTCMLTSCDGQMNTCIGTVRCLDLYQCLTDYPNLDLACQNGCYGTYPDAISPLQALLQCTSNNCGMECQ